MKLLFDQNLSYKLVGLLDRHFPGSSHLKLINLDKEADKHVWDFARINGFSVVSQDADFYEMSLLYGFPPKIVWLRCGNMPTQYIHKLLDDNLLLIIDFIRDSSNACLELF